MNTLPPRFNFLSASIHDLRHDLICFHRLTPNQKNELLNC